MLTEKEHSQVNHPAKLTTADIVITAAVEAATGAVLGGVSGLFGKFGVSLFNPDLVSGVGSFTTFAGIGSIAAPLVFLPTFLSNYLIEKSDFLNNKPHLKNFIQDTVRLTLQLGAVAASAAILSVPIVPAIFCMLIIPAIVYILKSICNLVNAWNSKETPVPSATLTLS